MRLRTKLILGSLVIGAIAFAASPKAIGAVLQLSNVAFASFPSAAAINEGGLLYDSTSDVVKYSNGTSWLNVGLSPGGNNTEVQYNNSGTAFGGIANFTTNGVVVNIGEDAGTVAAPSAGTTLFSKKFVDYVELRAIMPNSGSSAVQLALGEGYTQIWKPSGSNTMWCMGQCSTGTATTSGTISNPAAVFGGDNWEWRPHNVLTSSSSSNARSTAESTGATSGLGDFSTYKGFLLRAQFNALRVNATPRYFIGLRDPVTTMFPTGEPSAMLQAAYAGTDSTNTNWNLCSSSPDGGQGCVDCGASFDIRDAGTAFTLYMFIPAGGAFISQELVKESTQEICVRRATTTVPATTYSMACLAGVNNGATAAAASLGLSDYYARSVSQ